MKKGKNLNTQLNRNRRSAFTAVLLKDLSSQVLPCSLYTGDILLVWFALSFGLLISMSKDVWNGYVMNTNRMVIQRKDYTECIEVGEFLLFY